MVSDINTRGTALIILNFMFKSSDISSATWIIPITCCDMGHIAKIKIVLQFVRQSEHIMKISPKNVV